MNSAVLIASFFGCGRSYRVDTSVHVIQERSNSQLLLACWSIGPLITTTKAHLTTGRSQSHYLTKADILVLGFWSCAFRCWLRQSAGLFGDGNTLAALLLQFMTWALRLHCAASLLHTKTRILTLRVSNPRHPSAGSLQLPVPQWHIYKPNIEQRKLKNTPCTHLQTASEQ